MKDRLEELKKYIEEIKLLDIVKNDKKGTFLQSEVYTCYLNNGRIISREKLVKGGHDGSAVIVVPVTTSGEILTVIEPRVFTKEGVLVGFPAGYIEEGELPEEAARRELLEETGYVFEELVEIDSFYQDEGCLSAINYIFVAFGARKVRMQQLDKDEIIKYMLFTYDEILELEKLRYIRGANTKLAIAKTEGKIRERRR